MKKGIGNLLLVSGLVLSLSLPIEAAEASGSVTFTSDGVMDKNDLNEKQWLKSVGSMQPGDTFTVEMSIANKNKESTNWYFSDEIISSLQKAEEENRLGGGYGYRIRYSGPSGERTLYESKLLGGSSEVVDTSGLQDRNSGLRDYVFLDTLKKDQSGIVSLEVVLDGDTQGNDYQAKAAELAMQFATELTDQEPARGEDKVIRETKTNRVTRRVNTAAAVKRLPWLLMSGISGLILLILAFFGIKERKKEEE